MELIVVRAQGSVGRVSVEWRAEDGTAVSSGSSPDYEVILDDSFLMRYKELLIL